MSLLLALCGDKSELSVKEVPLNSAVQEIVRSNLLLQERDFRRGEEVPYDQNWRIESHEIATARIPAGVRMFDEVPDRVDNVVDTLDTEEIAGIRGLAMRITGVRGERILIQSFVPAQLLTPKRSVFLYLTNRGVFNHLESSGFRLDDRIVCIIETGQIMFRSLHKLGRIIDTSSIFNAATDREIKSFASDHSHLLAIPDIDSFLATANRNTRKYITSIVESRALEGHSARSLQEAAAWDSTQN